MTKPATEQRQPQPHPIWCTASERPVEHEEHRGEPMYVELREHEASATLTLQQYDDEDVRPCRSPMRLNLKVHDRAMVGDVDVNMTLSEAEDFLDVLTHQVEELRDRIERPTWVRRSGGRDEWIEGTA